MNNNCSVQEALSILDRTEPFFSFQQQNTFAVLKGKAEIRINKILPIRHPALIHYLERRKINAKVAGRYAREVHYSMRNKKYFAIGLENVSRGWELRNPYFKNAAAPKNYSFFSTGKQMLSVTEGMFDFFSLLTLYPGLPQQSDFLVLNSVSFIDRVQKIALPYSKVALYLDNDPAGKRATLKLMDGLSNSVDMSVIYENKKDLNQLLMEARPRQRKRVR
jgi:hypothetical protein